MSIWQTTDERAAVEAHEQYAVGKALSVVKGALKAITERGFSYTEAVNKLRRLDLTCDELQKLAATSKKQPKIVHASNEESSVIDDDDKRNPDEELEKLAEAIQRAHPKAGFSKAQAAAWAVDNLPEARWLTTLSKQKSLDRYGQQAAGYFDKFDKAGNEPGGGRQSWPAVNTRFTNNPESNPRPLQTPRVVRDPRDRADFDAGNARIADGRRTPDQGTFSDRVKTLMTSGLNFDQASTQALRERGNPDAISP